MNFEESGCTYKATNGVLKVLKGVLGVMKGYEDHGKYILKGNTTAGTRGAGVSYPIQIEEVCGIKDWIMLVNRKCKFFEGREFWLKIIKKFVTEIRRKILFQLNMTETEIFSVAKFRLHLIFFLGFVWEFGGEGKERLWGERNIGEIEKSFTFFERVFF